MKLKTLNRIFIILGFRLVVEIGPELPIEFYFVTNKEWKRRTGDKK
jgi:hypothetical protein